jgi:DNA-binding transcriptional ArsR family regulator
MSENQEQENTSSIFPLRWPTSAHEDRRPEIIELRDDQATEVFDALSSETARGLLSRLHDEPHTASDLASMADTSVQNVQYHLKKFTSAGLVEVVDVWYSSRGTEMKVYGPSNKSLVLYTGESPDETPLRDILSRVLGAVAILGFASTLLDQIVRALAPETSTPVSQNADEIVIGASDATGSIGLSLSPGILFFVGGLFVLLLGLVWWYWRQ